VHEKLKMFADKDRRSMNNEVLIAIEERLERQTLEHYKGMERESKNGQ
jgi:hypothetical protein